MFEPIRIADRFVAHPLSSIYRREQSLLSKNIGYQDWKRGDVVATLEDAPVEDHGRRYPW